MFHADDQGTLLAVPPPATEADTGTERPLKIPVVDDNTDAALMLAMYLETAGHDVLVEHGSIQALGRVRTDLPDVCLLDIGLPEMNGDEMARRLRAEPATAKLMLLAVTGYGQAQDIENSMAAGYSHHLVKPVDTAELDRLLARHAHAHS
ncbi:MAG: diguanylate cyclase [Polaromonas sp.]|jgi:CheY-like chemotaxis protein|nr:diguanylate cyclase [Polaromonas sp.]